MTTELTPQFAVTVRGYDRAQVDDYVDTLRNWHGNATARMQAAETEAAQLREQVVRLRQRVADLEQQTGQEPPRTITALGDRVTRILQLAEEAAAETRSEAESEARIIVAKAEDQAEAVASATRARQVEVEDLPALCQGHARPTGRACAGSTFRSHRDAFSVAGELN